MLLAWSGIALAGSTAMSYFSYVIRHDLPPTFQQLFDVYFLPPAGPPFWAMNFSILAIALVAFAAVRNHRLRLQAHWDAAQTELRGARLEAQLAAARLQALQAQINPHFLLNSLNAIASLVQIGERDRAFDAIGRLGELLRMALRSGRDLNVPLGDEINFLQSYLKLCKLRFESQFQLLRVDAGKPRRAASAGPDRTAAYRKLDPPRHDVIARAVRGRCASIRRTVESSSRWRTTAMASTAGRERRCRQVMASQTSRNACASASAKQAS